jgi:hypothetical protein
MKNYDLQMAEIVNDFADDYGVEGVLEELFGEDYDLGEIIVDMFNSGLIPNDRMEAFINE